LSRLAKLRSSRRILNQVFDGLDELFNLAKGHEQAAALIFDDFRNSTHVKRDARTGKTHRLQNAQTKLSDSEVNNPKSAACR